MAQSDLPQEITIQQVPEGKTTVFEFTDASGMISEGLVIRYGGQLRAFKNLCRHQPLPLDYGDGDFLDSEKRYLLCRNHGALFEPDTGLCVSGPCAGAHLIDYPVQEREGKIVVTIPYEEIDLE